MSKSSLDTIILWKDPDPKFYIYIENSILIPFHRKLLKYKGQTDSFLLTLSLKKVWKCSFSFHVWSVLKYSPATGRVATMGWILRFFYLFLPRFFPSSPSLWSHLHSLLNFVPESLPTFRNKMLSECKGLQGEGRWVKLTFCHVQTKLGSFKEEIYDATLCVFQCDGGTTLLYVFYFSHFYNTLCLRSSGWCIQFLPFFCPHSNHLVR